MHLHNVYFWLKESGVNRSFESGLDALTQDPNIRSSFYGRPSATQRDVIENSYSYGMVLVFDDLAGHDAYQIGAPHMKFLQDHEHKWSKVVVYDIDS